MESFIFVRPTGKALHEKVSLWAQNELEQAIRAWRTVFRGDVLVYAEGFGFGQMMIDTANLMTRAQVTIDYHAEFGESDRYYNTHWVDNAVTPLVQWLRTVRR
jgi:hypothetical protein